MADQDQDPKDLPKPFVTLRGFDAAHYQRTERHARQVQKLFDTAVGELSDLAARWRRRGIATDPGKPFAFDLFPQTRRQAQGFITRLAGKVKATIEQASRQEWLAACSKNDAFLDNILRTSKLTPDELRQYQDRNIEALSSFQKRKTEGMTLSDRVWRIADTFKEQMEAALDVAIADGRPAAELSRDVRGLLQNPDNLFRRVRDKATGELRLSKAAAAFHPGPGVYRSSYLNAMRLARTEVNMAYRQAEYLRWQQLDFVVGFRIWLSNNHTRLNSKGKPEPFSDICDQLAGDYPKTFKFVGWHPQCRCVVTPIMASYKEYNDQRAGRLKAIVRGETYKSLPARRAIADVPGKFRTYIQSIAERSKGWKNQPYYIRDNFKGGTIEGGLNPVIPQRGGQIAGTTKAPAPQPCAKFDNRIASLKRIAYTFGLDCSPLESLRTAGNPAALEAKLNELEQLQRARHGQWLDAETQLTNALNLIDQNEDKGAYDTGIRTYHERRFDTKRYYSDCINALKEALAKLQNTLQEAKVRKEIAATINAAAQKAIWFERGKCKIAVEKNPQNNGSTDMNGEINLTKERIASIKSALDKIKDGNDGDITESEADAMATLWHETTHNRNKMGLVVLSLNQRRYMELANEFVARKTLPGLYRELGCKEMPWPKFKDNRTSTSYNGMVVGYDHIISTLKMPRIKVLEAVKIHLFNEKYNEQLAGLKNGLKAGGFYDMKKADSSAFSKAEMETAAEELLEICRKGYNKGPNAVKEEIDEYLNSLFKTRS